MGSRMTPSLRRLPVLVPLAVIAAFGFLPTAVYAGAKPVPTTSSTEDSVPASAEVSGEVEGPTHDPAPLPSGASGDTVRATHDPAPLPSGATGDAARATLDPAPLPSGASGDTARVRLDPAPPPVETSGEIEGLALDPAPPPVETSGEMGGLALDPAPGQPVESTDPTTIPAPVAEKTGVYVHIGGGAGLALMSSDTITDLFGDQFAIGLGLHLSWSLAAGYRNLLQMEVRRGDSSHTLRDNNIVTNESVEIPMDYDFTEYVFKANLLALSSGNRAGRVSALFALGGTSSVEYLDEVGDGFKGDGTVLGLEYWRIAPSGALAITLGLRRYEIEFDQITLFGETVPVKVEASNYVLHTAVTFGLGF